MVRLRLKSAFTMIELIFAIVIISISMLTLPMMMRLDANSQVDALDQEGILIASTTLLQALTHPWDSSSSPGGALMSASHVVETGAALPASLVRVGTTDFRVGHFPAPLRRRLTANTAQRFAQAGAGVNPSISDFNAWNQPFPRAGNAFGNKNDWVITARVVYVNDTANYNINGTNQVLYDFPIPAVGGPISNIKMVEFTATDTTAGRVGNIIRLRSYSSNIGESLFYKRRY